MLTSKSIELRQFTAADIPIWYQWFNDTLVTKYMNKGWSVNTEQFQQEYFSALANSASDRQLAVILQETGTLVGSIGLHDISRRHHHARVSVVIGDRDYWGRGLATEAIALMVEQAFNQLNLHKLSTGIWAENIGSQRAFEKNGFLVEGKIREKFFKHGSYHDEIIFGLIRS